MSDIEIVDIDALTAPIGKVKIAGKEHDVLPASGNAESLLQQLAKASIVADGETPDAAYVRVVQMDAPSVMQKVVRECVPTLSDEDVAKLNADQRNRIIGVATRRSAQVQTLIERTEKKDGGS